MAYVHRRTGVVDYGHEFSSITKRSTIAGEAMPPMCEIKLGDDLYSRTSVSGWVHEHAGNGNTTGGADPTHLLGFVRDWATAVTVVGTRRLHGRKATLYSAQIDLRAAVEHELHDLGWSDSAIEQFLGDALHESARLKVWIDTDGLIRRVVLTSAAETETLDLSGFGVHVAARAPS
jgi:hypothetical protein